MEEQPVKFPKMTVRIKILVIFLILSIVSLVITGFIAFFIINDIGDYAEHSSISLGRDAVSDSTAALTTATSIYLERIAVDQAEITNVLFEDTEAELNILATQAKTIQKNPSIIPVTRSFPNDAPAPDPMSATVVWLAPGSSASPESDEYKSLAGINDLLKGVYVEDGDLANVYIATDSGILRSYPGYPVTSPDYDPRTRSWFADAKAANRIIWTGPYVDESGRGLIMTCSRAIPTRFGTWVFAADITTSQINTYTNITVGDNGYTLLMDDHGNIISRPGLSAGSSTGWHEAYNAENVFETGDPGLIAIGRNRTAGRTGIEQVSFEKTPTFVAYAPVKSMNWSLAVALPVAKVLAPVIQTAGHISSSTLEATQHIRQQTDRIRDIFAGLFCLLLVVVIILSFYLARIITRPVDALRDGTLALGEGNLDYRLCLDTGDEFEDLANSFNQMAGDLKINIEELRRTTAEKERYAKEMEIAKEIQTSFLPESTPDIPGISIAAITIPAMEIGGDLYDFIPVEGNRWGFVIADVSGKGVSAALFMALSCTHIHASGSTEHDPSLAIAHANRLIYEKSKSSMFITVFYGVLDVKRRSFSYVNAGHNPPILVRGNPPTVHTLAGKGIALGVIDEVNLTRSELELEDGDLIALYTDGVTEAFNEQEEPFGEERFMEFLKQYHKYEPAEIIPALLEEIRTFCGNAPQSDDITVVLMRITSAGQKKTLTE